MLYRAQNRCGRLAAGVVSATPLIQELPKRTTASHTPPTVAEEHENVGCDLTGGHWASAVPDVDSGHVIPRSKEPRDARKSVIGLRAAWTACRSRRHDRVSSEVSDTSPTRDGPRCGTTAHTPACCRSATSTLPRPNAHILTATRYNIQARKRVAWWWPGDGGRTRMVSRFSKEEVYRNAQSAGHALSGWTIRDPAGCADAWS